MAESKTILSVVTQVVILAAMAMVMLIRESDAGPVSGMNTASVGEAHRQRHGWLAVKQLVYNWNAPDKYAEFLSFEIKVVNVVQTKTYELT